MSAYSKDFTVFSQKQRNISQWPISDQVNLIWAIRWPSTCLFLLRCEKLHHRIRLFLEMWMNVSYDCCVSLSVLNLPEREEPSWWFTRTSVYEKVYETARYHLNNQHNPHCSESCGDNKMKCWLNVDKKRNLDAFWSQFRQQQVMKWKRQNEILPNRNGSYGLCNT